MSSVTLAVLRWVLRFLIFSHRFNVGLDPYRKGGIAYKNARHGCHDKLPSLPLYMPPPGSACPTVSAYELSVIGLWVSLVECY